MKCRRIMWQVFALLCFSLIIALGAVAIQPNTFRVMLISLLKNPFLLLLNLIPVLCILILFTLLLNNVFRGAITTESVIWSLSLANRIKIQLREEALLPGDLFLMREAAAGLSAYHFSFPWKYLFFIIGTALFLFALGRVLRKKLPTFRQSLTISLPKRLILAAGMVVVLTSLTLTVYSSDTLYYSFPCTNSYNESLTFQEYGFPYSFLHYATANPVDRPDDFDLEEAIAWDSGESDSSAGKKIHVVMVMNEAFSDLTDADAFTWSEGNDPLTNYHALVQDSHAISGHVVVPGFAGGTANTEFDVMTGMRTDSLSASTTTAFTTVTRNIDSLFRVYADAGYLSTYEHPGYDWFYNRQNVLPRLGAQKITFLDGMADARKKGTWVTDDYMADRIISAVNQAAAKGEFLFDYVTTIQNHMSYTLDKYGEGYEFPPVETTLELSEKVADTLAVYTEGIRDADAMLGKLTEYFLDSSEPVLLVFWGDHYPNLGSDLECYRELGLLDNLVNPFSGYATPYIMWVNDAGAEVLDWDNLVQTLDLPENGYLSAAFFGPTVLEICGLGESISWYAFLNQLRRKLPVVWWNYAYMGMDGELRYTLDEEEQKLVNKWRCWSYYKLKYKEIS